MAGHSAPVMLLVVALFATYLTSQSAMALPTKEVEGVARALELARVEKLWERVRQEGAKSTPADWADQFRNVTTLVRSRGYECEDHSVVTSDGYILSVQRLTLPKGVVRKGVVFLQHGILDSSMTWVIGSLDPKLRLPFLLVDTGFEVWMGNSRGNTYSRAHTTLDPADDAFWRYTFDDYASKDLPAAFDHVLRVSGETQLHYVGHSEGTLIGFVAFSTFPEVIKSVKTFVALAPVAYVSQAAFTPLLEILPKRLVFDIFGNKSVLSYPMGPLGLVVPTACNLAPWLCETILCMLAGCESKTSTDMSRMGAILSHYPAGTSAMDLDHFYQLSRSSALGGYDFGSSEENFAHYGQPTPPLYDVTGLKVPSALFSGTHDSLADPKDVAQLLTMLPTENVLHYESIEGYGHGDFLWAEDAAAKLYLTVIGILNGR
eukprot:Opistho-2@80785